MRFVICCAAVALLAGCSSLSAVREVWSWDVTQPQPKIAVAPSEIADLWARANALRVQRDAIRVRISGEPDLRVRQTLYAELHEIGLKLSPLERRLSMVVAAK